MLVSLCDCITKPRWNIFLRILGGCSVLRWSMLAGLGKSLQIRMVVSGAMKQEEAACGLSVLINHLFSCYNILTEEGAGDSELAQLWLVVWVWSLNLHALVSSGSGSGLREKNNRGCTIKLALPFFHLPYFFSHKLFWVICWNNWKLFRIFVSF